ncbi:MAG: molybdopterin-binding protein [Andreesenia angusta]|nr:molybdopterin-binding protein [Andreesenia angusta]
MKKKVRVEDSIGSLLAYDLTKIVKDEYKGPAFKKGHIIKEEDIEHLKKMGKYHIYVIEFGKDEIHEEEAAEIIVKATKGEGLSQTKPSEGKIGIIAEQRGILKINTEALFQINSIDMVMMATRHTNTLVEKGMTVAATRIIPLTIKKQKLDKLKEIEDKYGKIINIVPLKKLKVGICVTGTEVYEGLIEDKFGAVLEKKTKGLGGEVIDIRFAPDDEELIKKEINFLIEKGADLIMLSGGMSVDADDVTPVAIRGIADEIVTYGTPVLPGAMFLLAYKGSSTIVGIPACGMFHNVTVLDLLLPRIFTQEKLEKKDIAELGHGGLCLNCEPCEYPVCPFGK